MAKKTKARNQGQNQEQPVDAEIQRAAERIGYHPERPRAPQFIGQPAVWVAEVLLRATDVVGEIRAAHADRDPSRQGFDELLVDYLERLNLMLWEARWELCFQGGDKRIGLVETEVAS